MRRPKNEIVKKICKILRNEQPDYIYLRDLFTQVRGNFKVEVSTQPKKLPYVPTEEELKQYYKVVWETRNIKHMILIKVLLYTGIRIQELVNIEIQDVDIDSCQIRINQGKGNKDRIVPFPEAFKESLLQYMVNSKKAGANFLFESNRKKAFTTRGARKILADYSTEAGMTHSLSPHMLRHFLFTWLKKQGIDDALIQPFSGHETRQSLEIYSKLTITDAQQAYNSIIKAFPL